jgi:hypothetical protein
MLEDGELTPSAFKLVTYLGVAGGDRDGVLTTVPALASLLGISTKTVQRALRTLEQLGLIDHNLRQGQRTPFRIHIGTAAVVDGSLRSPLRPSGRAPMTEVMSGVTSDSPALRDTDRPGIPSDLRRPTSDTRARAPETETEKETSSPTAVPKDVAAGLSIGTDERPDPVDAIAVLVAEIADADENTVRTFRKHFRGRLPEAAFRAAIESLRDRRGVRGRSALQSEARYVFSTLSRMVEEGRYAQ